MKQKDMRMHHGTRRTSYGNLITAVVATVVILLSAFISIWNCSNIDVKFYDNRARLYTASWNEDVEKGIYKERKYPYLVCNLDGIILYADEPFKNVKGDKVNVSEMIQMDQSFAKKYPGYTKEVFLINHGGAASAFVIYLIPQNDTGEADVKLSVMSSFLPLAIGIMIGLCMLVGRILYLNRVVLKPIGEISLSSRKMITGNYDYEVIRVNDTKIANNEIGDLIYSFELMRDELKNKQITEEALKKSQQELISSISHDLKTPLSTIKAYAEGLRDGIAVTKEDTIHYANVMITKTNLLIEMIEDLLQYSNAQLNQLTIEKEELYFQNYFKDVMVELELYVKQQNLEFSYQYNMQDLIVNIDKKRITEVLYNLVENSMKYSKEHGNIHIVAELDKDMVLIRVMDDGIGISSDDIPYVFDKFYRAEKSRTSSVPGSGLGLSICKYIVEQHGGEIYCRSRKNEGCEIGFTIPEGGYKC